MASSTEQLVELEKPEVQKIIWAARRGRTEDVIALLDMGANVDSTDEYGQTTLMWALSGGNTECVKVLLNRGAQANQQDKDGRTPLMRMSLEGSIECVEILLDRGAQTNQQDKDGRTPLMEASFGGSAECVKILLERGAKINEQDKNGHTPLMRASLGGKVECVKVLLDHGAQIDLHDKDGLTPLMRASYRGNTECVAVLLDRGAQANQKDKKRTPLMEASLGAKAECVKLLLDRGAQVNEQDKAGRTPLMEALSASSMECVKLLLDRGANVNQQDKYGQTALMMASLEGDVECAKVLFDMGADANQQNEDGQTSLLKALSGGSKECVKLLLDRGAQTDQQDKYGQTPLMEASSSGNSECVQMLLDKGAQVNQQNQGGDTALHLAVTKGHVACATALLIHPGTDPNIMNHKGLTCKDMMSGDECFGTLHKMVETFNRFPVASYGKVVLFGNVGAGKSTVKQAIIKNSKQMTAATRLAKQALAFGRQEVVESVTAGIISHQVDSPYSNMIVHDVAGHHQLLSNRLEAIALNGPATFLLLQDISKDIEVITKELYYWSMMIEHVCSKCPYKSSVIVVGTHADLLTTEQQAIKLAHLQSVAKLAISHQTLIDVLILNLTKTYGRKMGQFMDLLHKTNDSVVVDCPPISLICAVLYAFLTGKLPDPDVEVITLSDLLAHLTADQDKLIAPNISQIIPLLKALSEKGLIFFIPSEDPHNSWIVLQKESILKKINEILFSVASHNNEYTNVHVSNNIGIVPKAMLKKIFPEYDDEMIAEILVQFELCQIVDPSIVDTALTPANLSGSDLGSLLFFPALVRVERPSSAIIPSNSFGWSIIVKFPYQFFPTDLLHVLLHKLAFGFMLPSLEVTPLHSFLNCCCDVWRWGIKWHGGKEVTTIVEMSDNLQSISLAVLSPDRTDPKYLELVHSVCSVVKKTYQDMCPHIEVLELISCPSVASSDHTNDTKVELSSLKKAFLGQEKHVVDVSDQKHIVLCEWMEIEPCLPYLIELFTAEIHADHMILEDR